jgi:hypothetical protein
MPKLTEIANWNRHQPATHVKAARLDFNLQGTGGFFICLIFAFIA